MKSVQNNRPAFGYITAGGSVRIVSDADWGGSGASGTARILLMKA
jgi:hypothetical protein